MDDRKIANLAAPEAGREGLPSDKEEDEKEEEKKEIKSVACRVGCSPNSSTCPRDANALLIPELPINRPLSDPWIALNIDVGYNKL